MKIDVKFLARHKACKEEKDIFKRVFPVGATVTRKNILKALDKGLNLYWFAEKFLGVWSTDMGKIRFPGNKSWSQRKETYITLLLRQARRLDRIRLKKIKLEKQKARAK